MGYHPGLEDDGVYLSAVKAELNPALFPHDADFVRLQVQATVFDEFMAGFVRITRLPVAWAELAVQLVSLYIILWAACGIAQMLFPERRAQWAAVALLSAMFTLPVAGTGLYIADQHLHPRAIATALVLLAVESVLAGRRLLAAGMLLLGALQHPIMAAFGVSFCFFLRLGLHINMSSRIARRLAGFAFAAAPMRWVFEPPTPEWRRALDTRSYCFLYRWTWYEWLGAIGPLVLFGWLWIQESERAQLSKAGFHIDVDAAAARSSRRKIWGTPPSRQKEGARMGHGSVVAGRSRLASLALTVFIYGVFQQALAMILLASPALVRVTPLQPMRYLHLEYVFLVLIAGGLIGRYVLGRKLWCWALFLAVSNGGMFLSQRLLLPASEHLELPGRPPANPWLQAFAWIRENTPNDARFALDPNYLSAPGEDYHSFRALAERSQLADALKDAAVVTQVPELAPRWAGQVDAQAGWNAFQPADFEHLKSRFGVDWVLASYPAPARLTCIWHNDLLTVCRIAEPGRDEDPVFSSFLRREASYHN